MAITKLTKRTLDSLEPLAVGRYFVWDAEIKGFGVRVAAPTGGGYRGPESVRPQVPAGRLTRYTARNARRVWCDNAGTGARNSQASPIGDRRRRRSRQRTQTGEAGADHARAGDRVPCRRGGAEQAEYRR